MKRLLASGGMGEVWLARNASTGAEVALKLRVRGVTEADLELEIDERFRNEARVTSGLSHRNIVKVFDLVEEGDGTLALVMERLRGEPLSAYLDRLGPRSSRDAAAIMLPILGALEHVHERGFVHRDVTPSNIFLALDPDGHVTPKLVDFGLAKSFSSQGSAVLRPVQTVDGRVLGTPMYMAPERIRGADSSDPRSDLFAAAVVFYEIISGACPFLADTPAASLAAVLERHVDPDPRIEPRLWIAIRRALAKQPYERHVSARELADEARSALGSDPFAIEAIPLTDPPVEPRARHPGRPDASGPVGFEAGAKMRRASVALGVGAALVAAVAASVLGMRARSVAHALPAPERTAVTPVTVQPSPPAPSPLPTSTISPEPSSSGNARASAFAPPATHPTAKAPGHPRAIATTPGF